MTERNWDDFAERFPPAAESTAEATCTPGLRTTRIYLDLPPRLRRERSPGYTARLDSPDGPVLVEDCSSGVIYAAARALLAHGMRGRVEMWDSERPYPRLSGDIEKLAKWTIREDRKTGPKLARWKPFPEARCAPKQGVTALSRWWSAGNGVWAVFVGTGGSGIG